MEAKNGSKEQCRPIVQQLLLTLVVLLILILPVSDSLQSWADGGTSAATAPKDTPSAGGLPLDNIQDVAFTLQRIRQQDINIYVEATRKKCLHFEVDIPTLCSVPDEQLGPDSAYLPLRKPWLVFFIGTMEPLVGILTEQLKTLDLKAEDHNVPLDKRPQWHKIVDEWRVAVNGLNAQLDKCGCIVDDSAPDNVIVAEAARAIDRQVGLLDGILLKASEFMQRTAPGSDQEVPNPQKH